MANPGGFEVVGIIGSIAVDSSSRLGAIQLVKLVLPKFSTGLSDLTCLFRGLREFGGD